uniref:lysM domain receptor-like kinase 4 n=1 Tax=Fragaria vesca subsp. vesca TaxID=101020 RepID=UPI0005CB02CD|nr:PREDICTED: lysM domain receptor-like kinase 4 [Fragaria vesca subsp. vesca]
MMEYYSILVFLLFLLFTPKFKAQQSYAGNSVLDCNSTDDAGPSSAFLYTCNGQKQSCKSFLIFKSQPPYNSLSAISNLTSSDPSELARINIISANTQLLPTSKEVIVPVVCSCSGQYYEAKTSFLVPSIDDTYFTIANNTYQGLSTCDALMSHNNYSATSVEPGLKLQVPLRCACPTRNQTLNGTKFLLTYLVSWDDSVSEVSKRFNVSEKSVLQANGFTEDDPTLFPFTTILIPLPVEPSSFQTQIQYPPPLISPSVRPIHGKTRLRKVYVWIGIGVFVVVLCMSLFVALLYHRKRGSPKIIAEGKSKKELDLQEELYVSIAKADAGLKLYRYEELESATDDFSSKNWLGGSVYSGFLSGNVLVAIKKMTKDVSVEVKLLQKINHFNLISLLGACQHCKDFYLVYEFMENGSLRDWLSCPQVLGWKHRVQIALDIANGLHYLHNFTSPAYVHKDIKSINILLNKDLRAKIANFSLARSAEKETYGFSSRKFAHVSKGYMAPEYIEYGLVTPAMDVYAFGVVMLELVTGKEAVFTEDGVEALLSEAVFLVMEGGDGEVALVGIVDPNLNVEHLMEFAVRLIKLSLACLAEEPEDRPRMPQVLSSVLKIQLDANRKIQNFL